MNRNPMNKKNVWGFTLLEILIALFIFTLVSMMLVKALHTIMQSNDATQENAARLRQLEMMLLLFSQDISQAIDRSVLDSLGGVEPAFVGSSRGFTFTQMGNANTFAVKQSSLQRTAYYWNDGEFTRMRWPVLDQAPQTQAQSRTLLKNIKKVRFQYLDKENNFNDKWPPEDHEQPLPKGIKLTMELPNWGKMVQFYVIPSKKGALRD